MKPFRTEVHPAKPEFQIGYQDAILTLGSCFTEHMGAGFRKYKFNTLINPFGQLYNPVSMASAMQRLLNPVPYEAKDLVYQDELYHSFDHHSKYSGPDAEQVLARINGDLEHASKFVQTASVVFLTMGTSHVFRKKSDGMAVANCHKIPQQSFQLEFASGEDICGLLWQAISDWRKINPQVKFVLTISPVRYLAFGAFENNLSKAQLFQAVHLLRQRDATLYYFPAFELVFDDLRDYRFYAEDMLHPNHLATNYVWEKVVDTLIKKADRALMNELDDVLLALTHKPRNPESAAHQKFVEKYRLKMQQLQSQHGIDFTEELQKFNP